MSSKEVVLLILGETGAGKSTFINYCANYFLDGKLDGDSKYSKVKIVIPNSLFPKVTNQIVNHSENNIHDKTKSQTSKPNIYPFVCPNDSTKFFLIDTPGFGDTDKSKDETNLQNILNVASTQKFISAIVLIINGSIARETTNLKYVIESMKGAVPNSLLKNIIVVLTNCNETTCSFELSLLKELNTKNTFHMQNSVFSNDLRNGTAKQWRTLENDWTDSLETLEELMNLAKGMSEGSAKDFAQMKLARENLQRIANEIIMEQKKMFQTIELINIAQMEVKDANERGELNKNFKKNEMVKVLKMKDTTYYSTVCQKHLQEKVCHEQCGLAEKTSFDESHFIHCAAANGRNCRICECPMSQHYHVRQIPTWTEEPQEVVIQEMKAKYDKANNDANQAKSKQQQLEDLKNKLKNEIQKKKSDLQKNCQELKNLCTHFNFYEELKGIVENLEKEAKISHNFEKKKEFENMAQAIRNMIST